MGGGGRGRRRGRTAEEKGSVWGKEGGCLGGGECLLTSNDSSVC